MGEWQIAQFKDYFAISLRNGLTKPSRVRGSGIRMVNMKEIFGHNVITDKTPMELVPVTEKELENSLLEYDDLLFARQSLVESGAGKISIFKGKEPTVFESHLIRCRIDKDKAVPDFIYYLFKSPVGRGTVSTIVQQVAAAGIRGSDLQNLEFNFPSYSEQKAIASVLSSLDDKIDLLHRQNLTLEAMAETLFRQWFVEEAQEDWKTIRVGDFVKTNALSINKNTNLKIIRYLDTGSLTEGKIEGFQYLSVIDAPSRAKRIVKHNDVLISTVRPNQKHYGIMKNPEEDIIVSTGFCVITCENINPHFIYILLTTNEMTEYLHSIAEASTSTYPSLKPSDIECLEFKLPPDDRLSEFSEYADDAWNKIDYNHIQIRTLEKLRDTLLPKLISGEVRVDEPGKFMDAIS